MEKITARKTSAEALEENTENMDPLGYFSRFLDVPETILHHLNGGDLVRISEVSSTWYNFIATSKVIMKKIKIVFNNIRTLHQEDYDLLINSSRIYESIEFQGGSIQEGSRDDYQRKTKMITKQEFKFLYEKIGEWKEIRFVNTSFETEIDLWELLSSIQSTVERLTLDGIKFSTKLYFQNFPIGRRTKLSFPKPSMKSTYDSWQFPKLKQLTLEKSRASIATILSHAVAVEKFELREVRKEVSMKMLKNFDQLTSLKLNLNDMRLIFGNDHSIKFGFKLKSFAVSFKDSLKPFSFLEVPNQNVCSNFPSFLLSQSDHLEELFDVTEFDPSCYSGTDKYLECFNLIMRMPKLKRLGLRYFPNLSEDEAIFHVPNEISSTITELRLEKTLCAASFKFLLKSMPNLKKLQIFSFNQELFETIEAMGKKFDELIVTNLELTSNNANHILINEDWKEIQFKLKRLSIGSENEECIWILMENARQNLQNFLKSQSDHLEELSMELACDREILNLIMKMRKLRSLSLKRFSVFSQNKLSNNYSASVTHLRLKTFVNSEGLKFLLESMPNIRKLNIFSIDQKTLKTLLKIKRKFEDLGIFELTGIDRESLKEISEKITRY